MFYISQKYDFDILEMEVDGDHIHLMVESEPKISPLQMIRVLKQQSTQMMWLSVSGLLRKYFWTDGYFVSTIGDVSSETLEHYIQNQG